MSPSHSPSVTRRGGLGGSAIMGTELPADPGLRVGRGGKAVEYETAVSETDFKGIVFLTQLTDPFGPVLAGACD